MSRIDAKSLFSMTFLALPSRQIDPRRLPVLSGSSRTFLRPLNHARARFQAKLNPAMQVLTDFRSRLRQAEELVAKLSFHMRELHFVDTELGHDDERLPLGPGAERRFSADVPARAQLIEFRASAAPKQDRS